MSQWCSLQEDDDDVFSEVHDAGEAAVSCGYVVHVPPPLAGPSLPTRAVDVVSVTIVGARVAPDVAQKMVTWYEVLVRTTAHQWSVVKRFSEFFDLYRAMEKMSFLQLARQRLGRAVVSPPSRLFSSQRRKQYLEMFLQSLLQTLKDLSVSCGVCRGTQETGGEGELPRQKTVALMRVALSTFISFLTKTSYDASLEGGETLPASVKDEGSPHQLIDNSECHHHYIPPSKIMHLPNQLFIIMLQIPGISMSKVFVESSERPREIVIGGSWNSQIVGPASVFASLPDTTTPITTTSPSYASNGGAPELNDNNDTPDVAGAHAKVLLDTFPAGDFQIEFEIPPPFAVDSWQSEYVGGVLFLMWRH